MNLIKPKLPDYDAFEWEKMPFAKRARLVCESWCMDGYGTPALVFMAYMAKVAGYIGLWFFFCSFTPGLGAIRDFGTWWSDPTAFQKAILLTTLVEGLGIAGSSGPLTGRYVPPFGGFLYFLRPGTIKLPLFGTIPALSKLPLLGGTRRTILDVLLYATIVTTLVGALVQPTITREFFIALAVLIPLMGLADKTVFLAFRSEHYWPTIVCFAVLSNWIGGAKAVQLAIWFWAGVSKLNHHFPTVVGVMVSNHPIIQLPWIRRRLYKDFPNDVRPSATTNLLAHAGTLIELGMPIVLAFAVGGWPLTLGLLLMVGLHTFIFTNVPMAVPLEWNVMAVYGAFALFFAHPEIPFWAIDSAPVALLLICTLLVVPLLGNLFPDRLSFLVSMRYYAGNWPYSIWLFRGSSSDKLAKLTRSAPWVTDQLNMLYEPEVTHALTSKVMGFRLMHLQGRAIADLLPKAVDRLEDYEYVDGEIVAGIVLGWNFGDGHLHNQRLLAAVQEQCDFDEGELRCICVEAQPIHKQYMDWRIYDAQTGLREQGTLSVAAMRERQPWQATKPADAASGPAVSDVPATGAAS